MRVRVTSVDSSPEDLDRQTPFEATLLRRIPGPDRPDYWLAQLVHPLHWLNNGSNSQVTHLVLAARWVGGVLGPTMRDMPVNIAYIVDPTAIDDAHLDFSKCVYVAIGVADAVETA